MTLELGLKGRAEAVVDHSHTAIAAGSGALPVFATPCMVALMEEAAWTSLTPYLSPEEGTVGIQMDVAHSAATPVGMTVWAESTLTEIEGKKLTFTVEAFDTAGKIGSATHQRFIIQSEKFLARTNSKLG